MPELVYNLLSGVVTGVSVAIILGLHDVGKQYVQRRQQINDIRRFVSESKRQINDDYRTQALKDRDSVTWLVFRYNLFIQETIDLLTHNSTASSKLSLSEKRQILRAFPISLDGTIMAIDHADIDKITRSIDHVFEELSSLEWL